MILLIMVVFSAMLLAVEYYTVDHGGVNCWMWSIILLRVYYYVVNSRRVLIYCQK